MVPAHPPGEKSRPPAAAWRASMRAELLRTPGPYLPSIRELAAAFRVGRRNLTRFIAELVEEGVLVRVGPRRIALADRPLPIPVRRRSKVDSLREHFLAGMADGRYRAGQPLPKLMGLALDLGTSPGTLLQALRHLAREGVVHRRGRAWVAGREPAPERSAALKTILVLTATPRQWDSINQSLRSRGFRIHFALEAQRRRYRILPVCAHAFPERSPPGEGPAATKALASELGPDLAGVLVVGRVMDYQDLPYWLRYFLAAGKPVVWFDDSDTGLPTVPAPLKNYLAAKARAGTLTRCHFSEAPGVELALDRLHGAGHRKVGFAWVGSGDWIEARLRRLRGIAAKRHPDLELFPAPSERGLGKAERVASWEAALARKVPVLAPFLRTLLERCVPALEARGISGLRPRLAAILDDSWLKEGEREFLDPDGARLLAFAESLGLALDAGATALLFPNDFQASYFARCLAQVGLRAPKDLSLLSFDNYSPVGMELPVTTVDFGFDHLGYCAFHALQRDIHLARDRRGNLPSQPFLVEQGTVGPPPRGRP